MAADIDSRNGSGSLLDNMRVSDGQPGGSPAGSIVPEVEALPDPVERGRYAVFPTPDGGWAIARSGPLCDTCQGCGCGEQQDPILVPAMVVRVITGESGLPGPLQKMLGRFGG